jgi:hypothetical protein
MARTPSEMRALADHWIQMWNSRDLDGIMGHYAPDIEFEANTVVRSGKTPMESCRASANSGGTFRPVWSWLRIFTSNSKISLARRADMRCYIAGKTVTGSSMQSNSMRMGWQFASKPITRRIDANPREGHALDKKDKPGKTHPEIY